MSALFERVYEFLWREFPDIDFQKRDCLNAETIRGKGVGTVILYRKSIPGKGYEGEPPLEPGKMPVVVAGWGDRIRVVQESRRLSGPEYEVDFPPEDPMFFGDLRLCVETCIKNVRMAAPP